MSRKMHPLSIGGTVLKESDDLDIMGVTFDSKMTFEKHLCSVSRAASQRLGILGSHGECSMIDLFLGNAFLGLFCPFWSTVLQVGARLPVHTLNYRTTERIAWINVQGLSVFYANIRINVIYNICNICTI